MRLRLLMLLVLLGVTTAAPAQIAIGINFSLFPELVQVPNYPVYYAPRQHTNYFFYDGMYWVYHDDDWYTSDWYNGPWWRTAPEDVPEYVLRVPVRYYRRPPAYFHGWRRDAPPRWGEHWGRDWEQRRSGWDKWNRRSAPAPAPLPTYQRRYSGNMYPRLEEQHTLRMQKYRYEPKDTLVRERVRPQMRGASAPTAPERQLQPQRRDAGNDARERDQPPRPVEAPAQRSEPAVQKQRPQQPPGAAPPREQQAPKSQRKDGGPQGKGATRDPPRDLGGEPKRGQGQEPQPREQQAPKSQRKDGGPQGKGAPRDPGGERNRGQGQEPQPREQQAPKAQRKDGGPQGKGAPRDPRRRAESGTG